jgi:phosphoribosylamine-glycine ligase
LKFGIASHEGVTLWLAARLQDEGHDVLLYHLPPVAKPYSDATFKQNGAGIVPLARTWEQFAAEEHDIVVFDGTDYGRKGDELRRRGVSVIGGCPFYDRLEKERAFAFKVAAECGMAVPKYHSFTAISDSMAFVKTRPADEVWFFKTDRDLGPAFTAGGDREKLLARLSYVQKSKGDRIKHILQEKIDGIAISTAGWWNGSTFLRPWEGTLERKEFGNDDTGPKTGCSMNVVWMYPNDTEIVKELHFEQFADVLRKVGAPPGIIDINAMLSYDDGKAYFLEFTPRFGFDAEPAASKLLRVECAEFFSRLCERTLPVAPFDLGSASMSIRLSVPPYPDESGHCEPGLPLLGLDGLWEKRFMAYGVMQTEQGGYELADPHGLVGLSSAVGGDLETMNAQCVKYAKSLGIADLGYRTDAGARLLEDLAAVRKAGYPSPLMAGAKVAGAA